MTNQKPDAGDGHRTAVVKTVLIVVVVVGLAFAFALVLTRRLISTWNP